MRLIFMGTPDFSVPALKAIVDAGHTVAAVYTQPPRPAKRGLARMKSAVHQAAEQLGLLVKHPETLRDPDALSEFESLEAEAAVVVAYGLILPTDILKAPELGCWNIHASLLPRWRGAAPIHRAILAGDPESGVTIMQMDEGLDTGPMLIREAVPISTNTNAAVLHDTLSNLGGDLIVEALEHLSRGAVDPTPQPETGVTYAQKLKKSEGLINWSEPAEDIARSIRGLFPWPGSFFQLGKDRIKVLEAEVSSTPSSTPPGTLISNVGEVACGEGVLTLLKAQRPGRSPVTGAELIRGLRLQAGDQITEAHT